MTRAAIYARVSTQEKQEYDRQVNELIEIIKKENYDNYEIFAEKVSGYKRLKERPELNKLITKTEEDPNYFSCIFTSEISRIGREPKHTREVIDRWSELKIPVYIQSLRQSTLNDDGSRNSIMNIILQVLMEYADLEAKTFKARSKSGLKKSAKDGKAGGGVFLPYGYCKNKDKKLIIQEDEAKTINLIFDLYEKGNGIKVISHILNQKAIPTRTFLQYGDKIINYKIPKKASDIKWSDKQVHDILLNSIYKGERKFLGEIIKAPAIISSELFDRCTEIRENKTTRNITTTYVYLLKDLIKCGKCGRNYYGRFRPGPRNEKVYKCSSTLIKGQSCGNIGINIQFIESLLFNEIITSESTLKYINANDGITQELEESIPITRNQIISTKEEIKNLEAEDERLVNALAKGFLTPERYDKKNKSNENKVEHATQKLKSLEKELKRKVGLLDGLRDTSTTYDNLKSKKNNRQELKLVFNQIYDHVVINTIDNDYMLITVYLSIKGELLHIPVKYLLELKGVKRKKKYFKYLSQFMMELEPEFHNGILSNDINLIKDEIISSQKNMVVEKIIKEGLEDLTTEDEEKLTWTYIPDENILNLNIVGD